MKALMLRNYSQTGITFFVFLGFLASVTTGCYSEEPDPGQPTDSPRVASATASSAPTQPKPQQTAPSEEELITPFVPDWVADAIFYQIFPERFRNGDPANDPTRESLESPHVSQDWKISPWTSDWYEQSEWEKQSGKSFYEGGVFDRRYGGDLQGVLDKLDYLESLGINAIYFNPVFYGRSLHKYDGASMHHIDPYFGPDPTGDLALIASETADPKTWKWTAADKLFLKLIEALHARSIRVIVDGVFNHTGRDFFAFADLRKNQERSPYKDWYIVQHFDDPATPNNEFRYKSWWGFETLPEFADNDTQQDLHPGPKQYVFDITRRWMDPNGDGDPSDGIDGWRLDVANEVPMGFWKDWNTLVRELNPAAYTVGEFWGDARQHLMDGRFSGTMNYHGFAFLVKGYLVDGKLTAHDFGLRLEERRVEYPLSMQFALQNLVDSHDTDRIASMIVNAGSDTYRQADRFDYDVSEEVSARSNPAYQVRGPNQRERRLQRMVALMQMTYLGAPMVYYGTEAGMWGGDDPDDRKPMVWDDLKYDDEQADPLGRERKADPVAFDQKLFDFYQSVIQLRRDHPVLRRGTIEFVSHDDAAKFVAFRRTHEGKSVLVAMNRGDQPFDWNFGFASSTTPKLIFQASAGHVDRRVGGRDQAAVVTIPATDAMVIAELPAQE